MASLFAGASPEFIADLSVLYFDEYAKVANASGVADGEGERAKLENWTREVMKKGGWI